MTVVKYLALLRGINVGGKNVIKMADLKACFDELRFSNVKTYIQSGNVIFQSAKQDELKLEKRIEKALSKAFNYSSLVVVIPHRKLRQIVERAPQGFCTQPDQFKYDVAFSSAISLKRVIPISFETWERWRWDRPRTSGCCDTFRNSSTTPDCWMN